MIEIPQLLQNQGNAVGVFEGLELLVIDNNKDSEKYKHALLIMHDVMDHVSFFVFATLMQDR